MRRKTHTIWRSDGKITCTIRGMRGSLEDVNQACEAEYTLILTKGGKKIPVLKMLDEHVLSYGECDIQLYPGDMIGETP